jgi:hypothetical protein
MTAKSKKIFITSETHETLVIRQHGANSCILYCDQCERDVDMLTLELATGVSGIRVRRLFDMIESGVLHNHETLNGRLFICGHSLNAFANHQNGEIL